LTFLPASVYIDCVIFGESKLFYFHTVSLIVEIYYPKICSEKMSSIKAEFRFRLPLSLKKEGKYYIAGCPVLDVYSQGESQRAAKSNLVEAITLFIVSCFERGTLDSVLKECGFNSAPPPKNARRAQQYIDVPIPMFVNQVVNSECHA
jgi:predicted RNase H-like HicB family nuclease